MLPSPFNTLLEQALNLNATKIYIQKGEIPFVKNSFNSGFLNSEISSENSITTLLTYLNSSNSYHVTRSTNLDKSVYIYRGHKLVTLKIEILDHLNACTILLHIHPHRANNMEGDNLGNSFKNLIQSQASGLFLVAGLQGVDLTNSHCIIIESCLKQGIKRIAVYSELSLLDYQSVIRIPPKETSSQFSQLIKHCSSMDLLIVDHPLNTQQFQQLVLFAMINHCLVVYTLNADSANRAINYCLTLHYNTLRKKFSNRKSYQRKTSIKSLNKSIAACVENGNLNLSAAFIGALWQDNLMLNENETLSIYELIIGTPAIRNLIREDKSNQIFSVMEASMMMYTKKQYLIQLIQLNKIKNKDAKRYLEKSRLV